MESPHQARRHTHGLWWIDGDRHGDCNAGEEPLGVKKVVGSTRTWSKVDKMRKAGFAHVVVIASSEVSSPSSSLATYLKTEAGESEGFTAQLVLLGSIHIPVALACAKTPGRSRVCMAGMLAGQYFMVDKFSPMAILIGVSISGYSSSFRDHMAP